MLNNRVQRLRLTSMSAGRVSGKLKSISTIEIPPTPTPTPTPTPPPTFLHDISGPDTEDGAQRISIFTSGNPDTIYYNNYDGSTNSFTSMTIYVNGQERAAVSYTVDRGGSTFGYSISGSEVQATGTFTNSGNVFLTI